VQNSIKSEAKAVITVAYKIPAKRRNKIMVIIIKQVLLYLIA
jgi:hypothetical protein